MKKITSLEDMTNLRLSVNNSHNKMKENLKEKIKVCIGGGCIASGSLKIKTALEEAVISHGLDGEVVVQGTGCLGPCSRGPVVLMDKDQIFYQDVKPEDANDIISIHVMDGQIVNRLAWHELGSELSTPKMDDISFFKRQKKVVLKNCGNVDPLSIEDYIRLDGYAAQAKAFCTMKPEDVIAEMRKSGLRGRGGAGFPTWMKWSFAAKAGIGEKYILCNADEGDPGAFMDRSVLEGDPHSIIEGMALGAYAIGASQGFVYVRAEYPLAVERLQIAIDAAKEYGFLGENILGSGFNFDLEIRMGSGAFVCGEETALMNSIEGKRGEPRPRPPFPAEKGLWGKPSVLNNVETFANVPQIINNGGDWFAGIGTDDSKGTKVFALAGNINNSGLVEVPVGTSLGELIYDIGMGIPNGKKFKAAQIGGPSGGCVPKENLNVALDYESLSELGAIMGSGGLIVMDEDSCMVDVAKFFLEFVQEESCGKCVPCRVGTKRMLEILERITEGKGKESDIDLLIELGEQIKETSLCGLGQTAPNPVLSTIRHFRHEYEAHIKNKHCEAGVCHGLVRAPCQSACPAHVDIPGFVSLIGEKRYAEALKLHRERNPFAAVCARVCFHVCEDKCRRTSMDDAVSIRALKRFMVDQEITIQLPEVRENPENAKKKIAIIGAGPAGLTCGYFLARLGYKPKVFESEPRPGGMLVQTIPAYRLPREILAREIRMIENLGVDIETNKKLGRDFLVQDLKDQGYEALFISIGSPKGVAMNIPGKNHPNVVKAMDFLRTYNLRGSVKIENEIVIVGGGNAAFDAARTAIRLGAEIVNIVYRRSQEEMPAYAEEIEEALQEGIRIYPLTNPQEIMIENDKIVGVRCNKMRLGEFDHSGRRRPINESESFIIKADQVIMALGQDFDTSLIYSGTKLEMNAESSIITDPLTGSTSVDWIFAGGDCATEGSKTVIEAVAAGERAAVGIDMFLSGKNNAFWREEKVVHTFFDPNAEPVPYQRSKMSLLPIERRKYNFNEVEQPWLEAEAVRQAQRCLRCDYGH
ncbi:MAG: NADH-quinone oxidoreductase subunit NuoF [Candidatus Kapabacteria bacterium]|nr:NADH-quinone oxidoreductase subunit NuoF [Ignavibacteriota bacterium]MCW5884187.1 NADH-quinone oxidoreductase subunit NuoF [Candidatus Kapabacteria bacterium]